MAVELNGSTYSEVDASNNSASPNGMPEGMAPSGVNDAWRQGMGATKRAYDRDHAGTWCTVGGTGNAITATYTTAPTAYVQGEKFAFKATAANTAATTFTPNSGTLAAKNVFKKVSGSAAAALTGGEIQSGDLVEVEYDGTQFIIMGPAFPAELVNAQTGTSYTVVASDNTKLLTFTNASAIAVTLPQATGSFAAGWFADITCLSSSVGSVTITPTTSTINGLATLVLSPGTSAKVVSDGTNYQILSYTNAPLRGYLSGLTLSNNGGTPNTKIDVAAGVAADSTNAVLMTTTGVTIDCGTTGANGLDTGSLGATTWYHVFLIAKPDGTSAGLVSTSVSAPSPMPSGYTYKRRIGSFKTDGSSHIITFFQTGDKFEWKAAVLDVNASTPTSGTQNTITVTVPTGVVVEAIISAQAAYVSGAATAFLLYSTNVSAAPAISTVIAVVAGNANSAPRVLVTTNTSAQVLTKLTYGGSTTYSLETLGWIDRRGRDA